MKSYLSFDLIEITSIFVDELVVSYWEGVY
jgi:hypothetical protein